MTIPLKGFVAYPSRIPEVVHVLSGLPDAIHKRTKNIVLTTWQAQDVPGYCLIDPIIDRITDSDFIIADVTKTNFNVFYEIGYAIGKKKRAYLIRNKAISPDPLIRDVGIFETIGYKDYSNQGNICSDLLHLHSLKALKIPEGKKNQSQPIYVCLPYERVEAEIRLISRLKKQARIGFRQFDPQEQVRLSVGSAIENIATSHGVILPLISSNRRDHATHNLRCAFLAGLSHALEIHTLILQSGADPVPLDYADAVSYYGHLENIDKYVSEFAPKVTESLQQLAQTTFSGFLSPIQKLQLGSSAAENEHNDLANYYVQTEEYQRTVRGEIQVVTGRKGSGKTALFYQVRNKVRANKINIVLDLNPEGYQLTKLKTVILDRLEEGTQEHTFTAFWEYLILLELCYKILEKDRLRHLHDHTLRERYSELAEFYRANSLIAEGDFAERLLILVQSIDERFMSSTLGDKTSMLLRREQITEILYQHDLAKLKQMVLEYLTHKDRVCVLFDNIDKGWSSAGVSATDLLGLRCLLECMRKLAREFKRAGIPFHGTVFIRNDVFEILVESTPDRGKIARVNLDWTDSDLMRELLRRRFVSAYEGGKAVESTTGPPFNTVWSNAAVTHLPSGEETSQYVINRSLMRPRCLLDFVMECKSHAVNLGHSKIEAVDFEKGEANYSSYLVQNFCLEIRDIIPLADDTLYAFVGSAKWITASELELRLSSLSSEPEIRDKVKVLLLWYGAIGIVRPPECEEIYIYDLNYDMRRLNAMIKMVSEQEILFCINPAFHKGLGIA